MTTFRLAQCRLTVVWYDLDDQPRRCIRHRGHDGPHTDGARWFDQHGLTAPALPADPYARLSSVRGRSAGWKERAGLIRGDSGTGAWPRSRAAS